MRSRTHTIVLVALLVPPPGPSVPAASSEAQPEEAALGGPATVWDSGLDAFAFPASFLDRMERRAFAVGNAFFKENWVTAPSSVEGRDGLGPLFVARSCSTCHLHDGRGRPPRDAEPESSGLLFRVGVASGSESRPHPVYGEQLQDRAVAGVEPEARVRIEIRSIEGRYADGTPYSLEQPVYVIESPAFGPLGDDVLVSPRVAPQLIGLGLLDAITEASIQARADPDDRDGDGISGRTNQVADRRSGTLALGRFGWKANQPTIEQQVTNAFQQRPGITSSLFPDEPLTPRQSASVRYVSGGEPELDTHKLERIAFYCRVLGVPARRDVGLPEVRRGASVFDGMGCAGCHLAEQTTGRIPPGAGVQQREASRTPICCCTTWDPASPMASAMDEPSPPSGARRRCGGSGCSRP